MQVSPVRSRFGLGFALSYVREAPKLNLPGVGWPAVLGIGVVLAGISAAGRSKLWPLAISLAVGTFFFVMYVMGS
jgi:hypothetical protein